MKCICKHFPVINDRCAVHGGASETIRRVREQAKRKPAPVLIGPLARLP